MVALNTVRTLTIRSTAEGVAETTSALKGLQAAHDGVAQSAESSATVTDAASKKQLSIADAYKRQTLALDESARSQDRLAKAMKVTDNALAQGLITQAEYAKRVDLVNSKIGGVAPATSLAQKAMTGLNGVLGGVSGQLIALSAGAGPVGVFLSALGPWGVAAAVGLGGLSAAFGYVADESARMGQGAIDLRAFMAVTGLTAGQISSLKKAGAELGVSGDTVASSYEKLTVNLDEARRSSGQLYEDILRIDIGLANELRSTTSTADATNVLAKAYRQAGDDAQRAAIARAAFGKGGAVLGPTLGTIADAGGIQALKSATQDLGVSTEQQIVRWATMQAQIDELNKRAKNIFATIFTEDGLRAALAAATALERAAKAAQQMADAKNAMTWFQYATAILAQTSDTAATSGDAQKAIDGLNQKFAEQGKAIRETLDAWERYDQELGKAGTKIAIVAEAQRQAKNAATDAALQISFLASGATIADRLDARLKAINSSYLGHQTGAANDNDATGLRDRATAAAQLDATIQKTSALNNILGVGATVQDQYRARVQQITKAQIEGAGATDAQIANAKRLAMSQADGTYQLKAQIDTITTQTQAMGLSVGAAETFTVVQTKINENINAGKKPLQDVTAEFLKQADALGVAKQAQAEKSAQDKASFDLATVGMSDIDKQIAQVQKSIHGNNWSLFMNDGLAATMRLTDTLKTLKSSMDQLFSGLISAAFEKTNFQQAASDLAKRIGVSLIDGLVKQLTSSALSSVAGGLLGGATQSATATAGATSSATILTTAGATLAAQMVAGATQAAAILGISGTTTSTALAVGGGISGGAMTAGGAAAGIATAAGGTESGLAVATGGVAAGAALTAGGAAAGAAIWGPVAILVAAVAAIGGSFLLGNNKDDAAKKAQEAWANDTDSVRDFVAASKELSGTIPQVVSQITQFGDTAKKLWMDAVNANDFAGAAQVIGAWQSSIVNAVTAFSNPNTGLSDAAKQIADLTNTSADLAAQLLQINPGFQSLVDTMKTGVSVQIEAIKAQVTAGLQADINTASGNGFLNDILGLETSRSQQLSDGFADPALVQAAFAAQAQKIVDDAGLIGDSFTALTNKFPDLIGVVHESTTAMADQASAAAAAAKTLQDSTNSSAKSATDYLTGLLSGSGATSSPRDTYGNALAIYNANLGQAQAGNLDAVNNFSTLADNLEKAARAIYGSSQGYQDIKSMILQQGLALPAVQQSTDPVVNAIRDTLTELQKQTAALGTINTNTNGISSVAANTNGISSVVANTNGISSVVANTNGISSITTNTGNTVTNTGAGSTLATNTANTATNASTAASNIATGNAALSAIQGLQQTSTAALNILSAQNTQASFTIQSAAGGNGLVNQNVSTINSMLGVLDKIAYNTFAISFNTAFMSRGGFSGNNPVSIGTYATGGTLGSGQFGIFGEHNPNGPWLMKAGSSPVPITPSMPSFAGANDNGSGAIIAELRSLRSEVAQLRRDNAAMSRVAHEDVGSIVGAVDNNGKRVSHSVRQRPRDNKAA